MMTESNIFSHPETVLLKAPPCYQNCLGYSGALYITKDSQEFINIEWRPIIQDQKSSAVLHGGGDWVPFALSIDVRHINRMLFSEDSDMLDIKSENEDYKFIFTGGDKWNFYNQMKELQQFIEDRDRLDEAAAPSGQVCNKAMDWAMTMVDFLPWWKAGEDSEFVFLDYDTSRGPPLDTNQWAAFKDPQGRIITPSKVKRIIFNGGVAPEIRKDVWKYLLGYYKWESSSEEHKNVIERSREQYFEMKKKWGGSKYDPIMKKIQIDIVRTDRGKEMFSGNNNPHLNVLRDILMTYCSIYNVELGYVQGMNELLAPLYFMLQDEATSFWYFKHFMDKVASNFEMSQSAMLQQLQCLGIILNIIQPELYAYLQGQGTDQLAFAFPWLLLWFKRQFDYDTLFYLWEIFWTEMPCPNFILFMAAALIETQKDHIMENKLNSDAILKRMNDISDATTEFYKLDVKVLLHRAEEIYDQVRIHPQFEVFLKAIYQLYSM